MITLEHVMKRFGEDIVLKDVSHTFEKGKIHGIIGNNGSGKTVMMKCICGFLRPTTGRVMVDGREVGKDMDFPKNLGVIIETPGFLGNLTGRKNLQILASLNRKIMSQEIDEVLRKVGLDPGLKKSVQKYSLGMRQRLGIAQAIMEDPGILILDEPFNGLDKKGTAGIRNLLKELKGKNKTIILASHNGQDIDELCDTVCEMDAGVLQIVRKLHLDSGGPSAQEDINEPGGTGGETDDRMEGTGCE